MERADMSQQYMWHCSETTWLLWHKSSWPRYPFKQKHNSHTQKVWRHVPDMLQICHNNMQQSSNKWAIKLLCYFLGKSESDIDKHFTIEEKTIDVVLII